MEALFNKVLQVNVRCRDCEERKANIRVTIDLQLTTSPIHKRDLLVRLTDDADPYFLFNLSISEEDFQSLKVQQGLLIDFASFPQKFIDLLNLCYAEQESDHPRFLLQLLCQNSVLEGPTNFSVVETNAFKHLNHLSLRLIQGCDKEVKDYLAVCIASLKAEKQALETKLKKTEDDLSRQLSYAQQTLSEKTKELDKLRSEWTSQSSSLSSRHSQELQSEREKAIELQNRLQLETVQLRQELESSHMKSCQQLQSRLTDLEASCRELTERKYKNESVIRDLKVKLVGAEEECQRSKQQVLSLRRENSTLDTEVHEKERLVNQLQMRVAVLEQEIKDKEQLMHRTKEVLEATQQQKESAEESAESKDLQIRKLEATVKSLSEELIKANGIIKKLQGEVRGLVSKIKVKNSVTVSQEKVLQDTAEKLHKVESNLQSVQQQLITKEEQVSKLKEQLESTVQKLDESKEVLKTNENVISWLNKQLNEKQLSRKPASPEALENPPVTFPGPGLRVFTRFAHTVAGVVAHPSMQVSSRTPMLLLPPNTMTFSQSFSGSSTSIKQSNSAPHLKRAAQSAVQAHLLPHTDRPAVCPAVDADQRTAQSASRQIGDSTGLDSKYFERRDHIIPVYGLSSNLLHKEFPPRAKPPPVSAYFSA